jgi:hypothetical protein
LKDKIKDHKNFDKRKKLKNQKKKDQIKISIIPIGKTKIKNLILKIKLEAMKTLIKEQRKKKSTVEGIN